MSYLAPSVYLLNYITTLGGSLEALYNLVAVNGTATLKQCQTLVDFRDGVDQVDHVKDALNFLHACGLLTLDNDGYSATQPAAEGVAFRLLLVQALRKAPERQGDFMRIHDLLVRDGVIASTDNDLITLLNRKGFITPGETDINANKAAWWIRTSHYLGLIRQLHRQKRFLVMPDGDLVLALLERAGARGRELSLTDWLRYCESDYLPFLRTDGTLHPGVESIVADLSAAGRIRLGLKDDATPYTVGAGRKATHVTLVEEGE